MNTCAARSTFARCSSSTSTTGTTSSTRSIVRRYSTKGTIMSPTICRDRICKISWEVVTCSRPNASSISSATSRSTRSTRMSRCTMSTITTTWCSYWCSKVRWSSSNSRSVSTRIRGSKTAVSTSTNLDGCRYWVCSDWCGSFLYAPAPPPPPCDPPPPPPPPITTYSTVAADQSEVVAKVPEFTKV